MNYSEEKLQELSLGDLIALKSYLINDRIKHWTNLSLDENKDSPAYQDYGERIQICAELRDVVESIIADRLNEIVPEYDI